VKDNLPEHAQDIYQKALKSAWEEYGHERTGWPGAR
jgi:cation transport regulator ChaB